MENPQLAIKDISIDIPEKDWAYDSIEKVSMNESTEDTQRILNLLELSENSLRKMHIGPRSKATKPMLDAVFEQKRLRLTSEIKINQAARAIQRKYRL